MKNILPISIFIFLSWLASPSLSYAEVAVDLKDDSKWAIALGGFWPKTSTTLRIDSAIGIGTTIEAEDDLAWDDRKFSPFYNLGYRFSDNHSVLLSYWSIRRGGRKDIDISLDIGEETYAIGTTIDSSFVADIYRVTYGYSFYRTPETSVAFLAGLHITNLEFGISAFAGTSVSIQEAADAVAPLPTFGFSASHRVDDNWYVSGWFQGLALEFEEFEGKMLNISIAATYKLSQHFVFSGGITSFNFTVTSSDEDARGTFDYEYVGPFLSLHTAF